MSVQIIFMYILYTRYDLLTPFVTLLNVKIIWKLDMFISGMLAEFDKLIYPLFCETNINV